MAHETILVVDDEPVIVQVIRERLAREGFQVHAAGDGTAALFSNFEVRPSTAFWPVSFGEEEDEK